MRLLDSFGMPEDESSVPGAMAMAFDELRGRDDVEWTYLSPSAKFFTRH
jgi:putative NADH-flavin reductase